MADPTLAVLLRNGPHDSATIRYALKCNDIAISYARTPMQIPIAQQSPELIDLGFVRPSLTCTGIVDTTGDDIANTGAVHGGTAGMASFLYTRAAVSQSADPHSWIDGGSATAQRYFMPYKNALEEAVGSWLFSEGDTQLQIEIGDCKYPIASYNGYLDPSLNTSYGTAPQADGSTTLSRSRFRLEQSGGTNLYYHATGGAIYDAAIQQGRFSLAAGREDRYDFTLQFVITRRLDIP
tara:strand:- start:1391 stop:2101 length:711 start_codon:yes stop_codon:yes gene_type:complete